FSTPPPECPPKWSPRGGLEGACWSRSWEPLATRAVLRFRTPFYLRQRPAHVSAAVRANGPPDASCTAATVSHHAPRCRLICSRRRAEEDYRDTSPNAPGQWMWPRLWTRDAHLGQSWHNHGNTHNTVRCA